MHAQQQDRQFWPKTFQIIQNIEPAFSRHTDVENDDIPILEAHTLDGLHGRLCFAESDFRKRFANRFFKPTPEDSVIVSNQYSHLKSCLGRVAGGSGIRRVKVVPVPGTLSTLSSPLSRNARSCIPTRPKDLRDLAASKSNPAPLSRTWKMIWFTSLSSRASTRVARAWRATLVSDS